MLEKISELLQQVSKQIENPEKGLLEDVFLFATEITPMVNVDLLIRNKEGKILLAWRDDQFYGQGWHVPGGILRLKELFEERIQRTALNEIGCKVVSSIEPIEIVPIISKEMKTRGHFITFVYECQLPNGFEINNGMKKENEAGYLAWHKVCPNNILAVHNFYKKYFYINTKLK